MYNLNNSNRLKLSHLSVDAELVFHADYFLKSESSSSSVSSYSSSEEEMEVEAQQTHRPLSRQQLQQQENLHNLQQQQQFQYHFLLPPQHHQKYVQPQQQQQQQQQHHHQQLQQHHGSRIPQHQQLSRGDPQHPYAGRMNQQIIQNAAMNHMTMISKVHHTHNSHHPNMINYHARTGMDGTVNQRDFINEASAREGDLLAAEYEKLVDSFNQVHEREKEAKQFKLPSSKSPIMEALVYCSINKYGIELKELNTTTNKILFYVSDFNAYYKHSCSICSKQSPSEDIRARMKALQRWFVTFPAWRELEYPFELLVRPSHYSKMHDIISKMVRFYENADGT